MCTHTDTQRTESNNLRWSEETLLQYEAPNAWPSKRTVRCGHAEATACIATSVMLPQPPRSSVVSCLHPEATATSAASVILPQP